MLDKIFDPLDQTFTSFLQNSYNSSFSQHLLENQHPIDIIMENFIQQ